MLAEADQQFVAIQPIQIKENYKAMNYEPYRDKAKMFYLMYLRGYHDRARARTVSKGCSETVKERGEHMELNT